MDIGPDGVGALRWTVRRLSSLCGACLSVPPGSMVTAGLAGRSRLRHGA